PRSKWTTMTTHYSTMPAWQSEAPPSSRFLPVSARYPASKRQAWPTIFRWDRIANGILPSLWERSFGPANFRTRSSTSLLRDSYALWASASVGEILLGPMDRIARGLFLSTHRQLASTGPVKTRWTRS